MGAPPDTVTTASPSPSPPAKPARRSGRRPSPRIEQYRRTWYFLRRNTLALIGLGIILLLVGVALYALTTPVPWYAMPQECATNQTNPTNTSSSATVIAPSAAPIGGDQYGIANGTYNWYAYAPGYVANPNFGTLSVSGKTITVPVKFTPEPLGKVVPSAPPAAYAESQPASSGALTYYTINFAESGLPRSTSTTSTVTWSILMNFTSPSSCGNIGSQTVVCTYPQGSAPPGPNCYQTPALYVSVIPPTFSLSTLKGGPLPLGALTQDGSQGYFYNLYNGLLRGTDWSLMISVAIVGAGAMIGLLVGAIAGFYGGLVDETLMRLVDIFLSIPQLLFVLITVAAITLTVHQIPPLNTFTTKIFLLIIAFIVVWWPFYSRIVRGQVLVVREMKYVEAARASGASGGRIVRRHIIPNSLFPVFIQMSLDVGTVPLLLGALVFLGFNIFPSPYFPEWGSISALSVQQLPSFLVTCELASGCVLPWWQFAFPGIALFLFAISVNFLSDGLRDALDPRLRR